MSHCTRCGHDSGWHGGRGCRKSGCPCPYAPGQWAEPSEPDPKETMRDLQKSLESNRAESVRLVMECENIIARLRPICDHSKDEPYKWEHDNGYGTQTWVTGKRCSYCGFIDYWSRGRFIDPASTREKSSKH